MDEQLKNLIEGAKKQGATDNDIKKIIDMYIADQKKKGSSEFISQEKSGVSPTRTTQQGTSSDTEPPMGTQASVALGGPTGSPFQSIDPFGGKGAVGAIVSEQQKTQQPSESYAVQVFKKSKSEVDENITEERLLEEKNQSGILNNLGKAAKAIWNVTGTGLSSVNEALGGTKDYFVIDEYKPLQDEKIQAKRELEKEGLPITGDNIQKRAEDIFRINDKRKQLEKRIDANLPEDYDRQGIWKELKLDNLKKNSSLKEAFISADIYQSQIKEFESYYNSLKNIPREQITQAQVDKYNELLGNANESLEGLKYLDKNFPKILEEVKSSDELLDVFKYNYNDYEKHLSNIKNFAKGIAGGTVKLMEETARYLDEKTGLDTDVYGFSEGNIKMANEVIDEASEDRQQYLRYNAKDISNFSDVGSFMAGLGTEQLPVVVTLAIAPEIGLPLIGAGTGGEQFRTMEIEESQPFAQKTTFGQKLATAYMYGGAEALFERLGTVSVLKNIRRSIAGTPNNLRRLIQDGSMQEVSKLGKQFGYNFGLEGGTEYLTAEAQIAADRYIAGKEISTQQANERRFESFVAGGLMGGGMTIIGGVWGGIAQKARIYSDNKDIKKTREILSQIERLSDEIKNNPNLTQEERVVIYKKMNELTNQSFDIVSKNENKDKDFNAQETQFLVDINIKQAELKAKLQEIKDSNFSKEQKQTFINELKDEYSKLEEKRNTTLQGGYNKLTELPSAEVIRLKDKAARELMKELNPDGTKTITINDSEITKRAIQLLESETKTPAAEEMSVNAPAAEVTEEKIDNRPIAERQAETESRIKNKNLFLADVDENGNRVIDKQTGKASQSVGEMISQSDVAPVPTSVREINGIEFVEFSNPNTGDVDVIVTGKNDGSYVGYYRLYDRSIVNGKVVFTPTNKWSSKFENPSRNKQDFKTMIGGVQSMLPEGHEYTEKTSISTDGLRVWGQQLSNGYQIQTDENGKIITDTVAINGDAIVNELGIPVNKGKFQNINVTSQAEFEKVKKALLPYLEKLGLNESNVRWMSNPLKNSGTVKIDLPVLRKTKKEAAPTEAKAEEIKPAEALKDVESTANALMNRGYNENEIKIYREAQNLIPEDTKGEMPSERLSEAYHKAKAEGTNPELVKAVEELIGKPTEEIKPAEVSPTEAKAEEVKPAEALKDLESTKKALLNDIVRKEGFDGSENQKKFFKASRLVPEEIWAESPKAPSDAIAEAYHKAKAEGTNPELVKAVEELLAPEVKPAAEVTPTVTEAKVAIPDQHREEYDRLIKEYEKDLADSKENLKSEKERSFFSRSRSYIKENENDIKFYENQIKLLKENPIEFYKNWIKSVEETHNDRLKDKSKYDDGKTYKERVIENYGTTDFNVVEASFIEDFNKKIADYEAAQKTANENAKLKKPAEVKPTEAKAEAAPTEVTPEAIATEEIAPSDIDTTLDEVITPASSNIKEQIARAKRAISKFLPNVEIVYHTTAESFQSVVGDNSRGYYDPNTKKIHINGSNANSRTVSHEVFHAVVLKYITSDKQATELTNRMFKALAKSIKNNPKLLEDINKFADNYSKGLQSEEKLAEFLGYLASEYETLPDVSKNIIQKWIEKIAKMVGIKRFTDQEVVDFMNTIATKVAYGQEITEGDVSKVLEGGKKVSSPSQLIRRQKVGSFDVEYTEKDKLDSLIKDNLVTEPENTSFMSNEQVAITSPDDMLVGTISIDGKKIFEGGGGVFFVTKYGDVWASGNQSTANTLANAINKSLENNKSGKGYLVLTKGSDSKLLSSSSGVNSSLSILDSMLDNGLISLSDFRSAVSSAVKTFGGEISLRGSAKQLKEDVNKYFSNPKESTFQKRGDVVKKIIETIAQSKNTKINKDKIIDFLGGDKNKGIVSKVTSENKNRNQSLSDLISGVASENLTKGLNVGDVYAIIEVNGEVTVKEDSHPSYPFHVVQKDGKKPILHLPKLRESGSKLITTSTGKPYSVGQVSIMSGTFNDVSGRKQVPSDYKAISNEILTDKELNTVRASLRASMPNSFALEVLDAVSRKEVLGYDSDLDDAVEQMIENGASINNIANILMQDEDLVEKKNIINKRSAIDYLLNVGLKGTVIKAGQRAVGRKQISPENSSNYANMTEDGKGNFVFYHFGPRGIKTIDPKRYGSNKGAITSKPEVAAMGRVGGMSQFYTMPEYQESNVSGDKYMIKVPMDKVYDFNTDPDNFYDRAREMFKAKHPDLPFTANDQLAYITKLAEKAGYDMTVAEWNDMSRAQSTKPLKPVDTQFMDGNVISKPFQENYESNSTKGFVAEVPTSKEAKLKDVYQKINAERNAKNRYDSLYSLAEDFPKLSQDKITDMIESSDISKEMKDAYAEALAYEPGTRMSGRRQVDAKAIAKNTKAEVDRVKALPINAEDGATFNLDGTKYEGGGLVVPMNSLEGNTTQEKISPDMIGDFAKENEDSVGDESMVKMGIYKFPDSDTVSIDMNIVIPNKHRDVALEFGKLIGQESLFDLDTFENVKTGGDGLNPMKLTADQFREAASSLKNGVMPTFVSGRKQKSPIDTAVETAKRKGFNDKEIADYLVGKGYTRAQATNAILRYNNVTATKLRKKDSVFTKEGRNKIITFLDQVKRRALSAKSFLPKSVFILKEGIEANIKAEAKRASYLVDDFNKLVKGYKGDLNALNDEFDKYLRGDQTAVLPDEFKAVAGKMRMHIDNLSQMLLRTGAVTVSQAETIAANLGQYINRSYQVFDKKNWAKQVTEEMKEAARVDLRNMYKASAEAKAKQTGMDADIILEKFINDKIDELISGESAATFLGIGKTGSKDLSIMKQRLDIPLSIRQLMGEYTDASQNYARTVLKIATLAENARFLQSARDAGMGVFFFKEGDLNKPSEFNVQIAGEGSETMNPLNGLFTTKEIADAFKTSISAEKFIEGFVGPNVASSVVSLYTNYMKLLSVVKWNKTIASVATHFKNVTGNIWFMLSNGYFNYKKYGEAFNVLRNSSNEQLRDKLDEYIRAGIIDQSAALGEIKSMFSDADFDTAIENRLKKNPIEKAKKAARWVITKLNTAYQLEDDFYKIVSYESEKDRYSNAEFQKPFDQLTEDQKLMVSNIAAENTKNVLPNYARIPGLVKLIKIAPVTGTFISFQAEAYRTAWNTVALAFDELSSSNKKIKAIGAKRLAGIAFSQSVKFGLMTAIGTVLRGGDDDDEEDKLNKNVREFVPEWSKKSDLALVEYGNGKFSYVDFSASDPHGGIKKAYNSFMAGDGAVESFTNGMSEILGPFVKKDMLLEAITDINNNENSYGGKLYNDADTNVNKINAVAERFYKVLEPGSLTSARKIAQAENVGNELAGQLTGYKVITIDVGQQLGFKMNKSKDDIREAKRLYNSAFYKFEDGKMTAEELESNYNQANSAQKEMYKSIMDNMKAASFFGVEDRVIDDAMEGIGKGVVNDLWYGDIPDMKQKQVKLTDAEFRAKYGEKVYNQMLRGRELLKKGAK